MLKRPLLGLALMSFCAILSAQDSDNAAGDRFYVTDELRLSMYSNANDNSQVLKLLESGDSVDVLQIQGPYALVLGPDGTRGWVKRGFLVPDPTAKILLQEEREKSAELAAEIEKLANSKAVIEQYEKDLDQMATRVANIETEKDQADATIVSLQQQVEARQRELEAKYEDGLPALLALWDTARHYWAYLIPVVVVIVLLTWLISKMIIESRIKSRFHGIKIW